jgi:hypothetical protein
MSEDQTLSYESTTESVTTEENLTPEEQDSLEVGEQMQEAEDQLLAGKYKDAKDLEKAYNELEKKLGEKSDEVPEEEESENETEEEPSEVSDNILDELWDQGTKNNLSKDTFEKLQKMDPVEVAKLAMEQRNQGSAPKEFTEQDVQQIHGLVGGEENYKNMMGWATQNVSEQEVNMYDAVMDLGNPLAAYFAVQTMALKYQDASGKDGEMITGKPPRSTADVFKSQAEMIKAMDDDRYADDPAYREAILDKLERSDINF